jgi:hypothetical protein
MISVVGGLRRHILRLLIKKISLPYKKLRYGSESELDSDPAKYGIRIRIPELKHYIQDLLV